MSVHFPKVTKHDLEVVVEAMDRLREALAAAQPPEVPAEQVLAFRCMKHREIRPLNANEASGAECPICAIQNMPPTPDKDCCVRCNAPSESTIHDAFSKNTEIRMAAHQFVPAVVPVPAAPPSVDGLEGQALKEFTEYFVANYPGPETIIHDPRWHAPKIFRAAQSALRAVLVVGDDAIRAEAVKRLAAAPPSVDGLEAQCALIEELRYQIREAWPAPWSVEMFPLSEKAVAGFAAFIRNRDRELVEVLREAEEWIVSGVSSGDHKVIGERNRLIEKLRAVLAARKQ